jgi:hypothetical protein
MPGRVVTADRSGEARGVSGPLESARGPRRADPVVTLTSRGDCGLLQSSAIAAPRAPGAKRPTMTKTISTEGSQW